MGASWVRRGFAVAAAGAGGAAIGLVTTRWGVARSPDEQRYVSRADYAVWAGTVVVQTAVWCATAAVAWGWDTGGVQTHSTRRRLGAIAALAAGMGAAFFVQFLAMRYSFDHYPNRQETRVFALGAVVAITSGVTAERLYGAVAAAPRAGSADSAAVVRFQDLWALQRRALFVLGTTFTLVMVASAAKARANESFRGFHGAFPNSYLLVAAMFYVGTLFAVYLPAHFALSKRGATLAVALARSAEHDIGTLEYQEQLAKWRTVLGIDVDTRAELERGILLLAPLISALASSVFGK